MTTIDTLIDVAKHEGCEVKVVKQEVDQNTYEEIYIGNDLSSLSNYPYLKIGPVKGIYFYGGDYNREVGEEDIDGEEVISQDTFMILLNSQNISGALEKTFLAFAEM